MPIDILSPNLGIQNILSSPEQNHMPDARPLASTVLREAGMDELYNHNTADRLLNELISPSVGDGSILQPAVFQSELKSSLNSLRSCDDPRVQAFLRDELQPLLDNTELLKAYEGLMVGG